VTRRPTVLDQLLPAQILRAEFSDPTLLLGGEGWSLSATCLWRWVDDRGAVAVPETSSIEDTIWNLVGDAIVSVDWSGPASLGLDPTLRLSSGGELQLLSDAAFDTWVIHTATLVLVGPFREK
jgi:hypothetical protein